MTRRDRRTTGQRKSRRRWWLLGGAIVALGAVLVVGVRLLTPPGEQGGASRTLNVPVTTATEKVLVILTGTLAPRNTATLSFGTSGKVTSVNVKVGQAVKAGEVLATIDNTQLANDVALAKANLTAARTSYTSVAGTSGVTSAQLANAQAEVDSAKAKLASAQASLADAKLTTPISGTVATVDIKVGDQAGSSGSGASSAGGTAAASSTTGQIVVISPTTWQANATVGPADVGSLKVGQPVNATVSGATATTTGTISSIGVVATTTNGSTTFPVVVKLTGNPKGFYDGVSVTLGVTIGTFPDVVSVPTLALTSNGSATTVQKIVGDSAVTTTVETGQVFGDRTQIVSGLAAGDQVQITTRFLPGSQSSSGAGEEFPVFAGGPGGSGGQGAGPNGGPGGNAAPPVPIGGGNGP